MSSRDLRPLTWLMSSRDLAMSSRDLAKSRMRPGRIQQPDYAQQGPGQVHHEPDHLLLEGIMVHNDPKWNMDAGLGALVKS